MKEIKAYQQKRKGSNRRVLDSTHKTTRLNMESNCIQWVNIDIITAPPPPPTQNPMDKRHTSSLHTPFPQPALASEEWQWLLSAILR